MRSLGVLATALVLALSGCSGDEEPEKGPDLPTQNELTAYFGAVASYDTDALAAAAEVARDGSPAQAYLGYLGDYAASADAAGQPVAGSEVKAVDGGFTACGGTGKPDECVTWSDLEGEDGALTDFTVNDVALDDSLVDLGDQAPVAAEGLYEVQPDFAYRSPQSGTLFVTVTVTAGDVPVSPEPGVYIEQDQILNGTRTRAPATVEAGASTPVVLAFPHAEKAGLDGQVTFDLGLAGQGTQSIGFGLATSAG
ncbi:hypothetical protein G5V58_05500 [Nocardioides anomalus]|uniref:Lipoprotein n=1 Tax=Nocardioides anomalus TaxID=2712223 RepID=A0A6G6WAP2_9ACTN|nr:hypothetical protein [Nocardioides anomalus]QIG42294.1 hypothetical protein G5V58_05500 [Nocardioides anomalus]